MARLIAVLMGQDGENFITMALESVKNADAIIVIDGGSKDKTLEIANKYGARILNEPYDQKDKGMNGKQRNKYLNYVKEHYPDDWCLAIDYDEVVEDLDKIIDYIQTAKLGLYSIHMRHFEGNLGFEQLKDNGSADPQYVLNRLFKISEADKYPEIEHPVLQPKKEAEQYIKQEWWSTNVTTIWHLSYVPNVWDFKKKYKNHLKKSDMHTPEYLRTWYYRHLFGRFPSKPINLEEIPKTILTEFGVDRDELYFSTRGIELKHGKMVKEWYEHFKPKSVLDLGCGLGCFLYYFEMVAQCAGIEISEYAVKNKLCKSPVIQSDVSEDRFYTTSDLILAVDILEHLDDERLDKTLKNIAKYGKKIIFSIPYKNNPCLYQDKTHLQFHDKQWWIDKISSYGIKLKDAPNTWNFHEQIFIGET